MSRKLSVLYVKENGSGGRENAIRQLVYTRSGDPTFNGVSSAFSTMNIIFLPNGTHLNTDAPFCAVNRRGASGAGAMDLFVLNKNQVIERKTTTIGIFTASEGPWEALSGIPGVNIESGPAASCYVTDRIALAVRGDDNQIYRRFYDGANWGNWINSGAPNGGAVGEPAIIGYPNNGYRLYARNNNNLWQRTFNGSSLSAWTQVPNVTTTASPEGVDVSFYDDQASPNPFNPLVATFPTPGTATNIAFQQEGMNVFYRGLLNEMRAIRFPPSGGPFTADLSGSLTSSAGAAYFMGRTHSPYPTGTIYKELHTFVRGADANLYGRYVTIQANGTLSVSPAWYNLGVGQIATKPDAVTWHDGLE